MAVGTVTLTESAVDATGVARYRLAWVSSASGAVTGNAVTLPAGSVVSVEFTPDAGGTQPSDLYDLTLTDSLGINVLDDGAGASLGANLSNATSTHKIPFVGGGTVTYVRRWLHGGSYTLNVSNAGNAKGGTVDLYLTRRVL